MNTRPRTPVLLSTQFTLPFTQLEPRRFEDLCLRFATRKFGLIDIQHLGRAGADGGADIFGSLKKEQEVIAVAIQCKRHEKLNGQDIIRAVQEFHRNYPEFKGQFWIMTSACPSKKAREQFKTVARGKKLESILIDGTFLEDCVRNSPEILGEFFSTFVPQLSPLAITLHEAASAAISRVCEFEHEFLYERDRSFSGNHEFVLGRQRVMGQLLNIAMLELRSGLALLPDVTKDIDAIRKAAVAIISNYESWGKTHNGLPFHGKEVAIKALEEGVNKRAAFEDACERLVLNLQPYLQK